MTIDNNNLTNEQKLTEKLLSESRTPRKKAKGVKFSASTGISFNTQLQKLVNEIRKDINQLLIPLVKSLEPQYQQDSELTIDGWSDDISSMIKFIAAKWNSPQFKAIAESIASEFIKSADRVNRNRFNEDMKRFGIDVFGDSEKLREYIRASIFDSTRLITSIPEQYLTQVESIIMGNMRAGRRPSSIVSSLQMQFGVTKARAKLIARDQTSKVNGELAEKRQRNSGFEYFQWLDSDDERVRDRHEDIANKITTYGKGIYRWDNPPLSLQGKPITPGQDYQCRCTARPVLKSEVEENQKAGRTRPGVKR